jgi:hypothetical protein
VAIHLIACLRVTINALLSLHVFNYSLLTAFQVLCGSSDCGLGERDSAEQQFPVPAPAASIHIPSMDAVRMDTHGHARILL